MPRRAVCSTDGNRLSESAPGPMQLCNRHGKDELGGAIVDIPVRHIRFGNRGAAFRNHSGRWRVQRPRPTRSSQPREWERMTRFAERQGLYAIASISILVPTMFFACSVERDGLLSRKNSP